MLNIRHTGIVTSDIDKSISFYETFGFKIQKDMIESGSYIDNFSALKDVIVRTVKMSLDNGDMIELLYYHTNLYQELMEKGVLFNSEPQHSPDGYAKVTFCKDPDGSLVELVEVLK